MEAVFLKKLENLLPHILYLLVGGACGIFMVATYSGSMGDDRAFFTHVALSAVFLLLAYLVQIVIHEAGHLVFGLLTGYKFLSFRIANFMLIKENGRFAVKFFSVPGTAGQCLMLPPEWDEKMPFRLYNLGGCIANAFTGALFLLGYFLLAESPAAMLLGMLGLLGIVNLVLNGIPMKVGGIANDGQNTLVLGKSKTALRAFWLQLHVNGLIMQGVRMANMPKEWFFLPEGDGLNDPIICTVGVLKYNYDFDTHNFAEAEKDVEYMLKAPGLLGLYKNELLCEQLFLKIYGGAPAEEINALFDKNLTKYIKATSAYPSRRRLLYAYFLLCRKDVTFAERELKNFEEAARRNSFSADVPGEIETVELIKAKAEVF